MPVSIQGTGTITVNGVTYTGRNIRVDNDGTITIDGAPQDTKAVGNPIEVTVTGPVERIDGNARRILVHGEVGSAATVSGDLRVEGNVSGSVSTISGDLTCGSVAGSVSTVSGDIRHR